MNKKNIINIILVIIWMSFIFIMSSFDATKSSNQSNFIINIISNLFNIDNIEILSLIIRKSAHFTEYLILSLLVSNLINGYNKKIYISLILCILYAMSDEIHQGFVAYRSPQITDVLIDSTGAFFGVMIIAYCFYKKGKKDSK
jgi:VanZ family protein